MKDDRLMVSLKLSGRRCLVVGSGDEAAARAARLCDAGARVMVIGLGPNEPVRALAASAAIDVAARPFDDADLDGCRLVVLTDRDPALAARLDAACAARNILFCAVDQPAYGDYAHVALVKRGPLTMGIATGGRAPALAARLREELSRLFDDERLDAFIAELEELRAHAAPEDRARLLKQAALRLCIAGQLEIRDDAST